MRREIVFEELKNGSFVCRDGRKGAQFGEAGSIEEALAVAYQWLTQQDFEGEALVLVKPWKATPFTGPTIH